MPRFLFGEVMVEPNKELILLYSVNGNKWYWHFDRRYWQDTGPPPWLSSKESPAMQETQEMPGGEYTLEEGMATHPSILAWRIP